MNTNAANLIIQIIGLLVSISGFIAVVISLRQVKRSLEAATYSRLYDELHEIHRVFIDFPAMRPCFYHNEIITKNSELYNRARAIAEMYLDIFEHIYMQRSYLPKNVISGWDKYIHHMCSNSIFLKDYLLENTDLIHPSELQIMIKKILSEGQNSA